ncbi:hypothetical protein LSAT2_001046 [Lamellibrachia satsuma]|nr:hypothetical protein LSAT2_001046 [Lamellibrachia satsuma]
MDFLYFRTVELILTPVDAGLWTPDSDVGAYNDRVSAGDHVIKDGGGSHSPGGPVRYHSNGSHQGLRGSAALATERKITDGAQSRQRYGSGFAAGQLILVPVAGQEFGCTG